MIGTIRKILFLGILIFSVSAISNGQSKKEIENRMQKTNEEIQRTNKLLEENINKQKTSLNKLLLIKRRISLRESLISDLSMEIDIINKHISIKQDTILVLESKLEKLRREYAKMIYFAYKNKSSYDKLMFILASEDFNQAYRRMKYFEQYTKYRKRQANQIVVTRKDLEYEIGELTDFRNEKENALSKKEREKRQLSREKNQQNNTISRLKNQQDDLRKKIREAERIRKKLQKAMEDLIAKEAEKNSFYKKLTSEESRISNRFLEKKGKHIWPVEKYVIISPFGIHDHPILKGVKINNEGVDLRVTASPAVRTIFDGEVKKVFAIPGANVSVIIRHGHYLTLYSNLTNVQVQVGNKVKMGDHIGDVFSGQGMDNDRVLHFRVYEENKKMNPEHWLK